MWQSNSLELTLITIHPGRTIYSSGPSSMTENIRKAICQPLITALFGDLGGKGSKIFRLVASQLSGQHGRHD